ncbi:MAG: EMC3/TMCO1 family protein [Candidatus Aenigmatarchaeota archaeon]|nr:DUF106 domain-containing protein [Candidatus Aenigmarchaeota archaeon]
MIEVINNGFNFIFSPILELPPIIAETIIVALIIFIITLLSKYLVNQEKVKQIKAEIKSLQEKIKELQKTNPSEANKHFYNIIMLNNKLMRLNLKSMVVSLLIFILFFPWLSSVFLENVVIIIPYLNIKFGWLMWYLITSLTFSFLFRKILNVE